VSWDYGRLAAEVYELDKPVGSSFPGLRYYTRQLAGVTGRILEPATGTGRVLVPLLEAGFAVEGLDVSPDMLAAFRESLSPGGRLILDVGAPELITGPAAMRYWERDPYLWTLQDMRTVYDPVANQTTSSLRYEKWRDGGLIATELQRFRLQYWSLTEFERLLADAGFTDINVTADYRDDHRPRPDSRVWTFHAIRPR
jgi:SAM-dependent methyltransferase